jgi:tyrosinase
MTNPDRRTILKQGAACAAAVALPAGDAWAQNVVTRVSINSLAPNDPIIASYRQAVSAMRALPQTDPRNWRRQAQIHNSFCPHRNWFFLPWHRAYLVAFERICRQLSNNPNFALPYWDWTANPQLPAAFARQTVGGAANPLFDSTRSSQTVTIPGTVAGQGRINTLLAENSFEVFASSRPSGQNNTAATWLRREGLEGPFESGPHDQVHVRISGNMASFTSPLDPIFWLHHCNIDRLWDRWNRSGRTNTSNTLWRNFAFNGHFVTPSGTTSTPFNVAVSGLLNIGGLGYRYVAPAVGPAVAAVRSAAGAADAEPALVLKDVDFANLQPVARVADIPAVRVNAVASVAIDLPPPQVSAMESIVPSVQSAAPQRRGARRAAPAAEQRVLALIKDVDPPRNGNCEVRVFVNHPDLKPDTPEQDRHFAGAFTFFGTEHAEHAKPSYLIDLTATVRRLNIAEVNLREGLKVQLMPVPIPGVNSENVEIKVGSIEIAIL